VADEHESLEPFTDWIAEQHVFFVATAPSGDEGHVNLSPKGLEGLVVLGPRSVAYLDLTGSGAETIAHVQQNGRICLLLCAFTGSPRILRLQGTGTVHRAGSRRFDDLRPAFGDHPGVRSIITVELDRIATSCGYGVPLLSFEGERRALTAWAEKKGDELPAYWSEKNATSIDGLPAVG
jgi:Pyridoxamine 5'-phosphate oxidase